MIQTEFRCEGSPLPARDVTDNGAEAQVMTGYNGSLIMVRSLTIPSGAGLFLLRFGTYFFMESGTWTSRSVVILCLLQFHRLTLIVPLSRTFVLSLSSI